MSPGLPVSVLAATGAYTLLVPLPANAFFTDDFRLSVFNVRPYLSIALAVFLAARLYAAGRRLPALVRPVAWVGLAAPAWYVVVDVVRGPLNVPLMGLQFAWWLVAFVVAPMMLTSPLAVKQTVAAVAAPLAAVLAYLVWLDRTNAPQYAPSFFRGLDSLGFLNPDYYGQTVQAVVVAGVAVLAVRRAQGRRPLTSVQQLAAVTGVVVALYYTNQAQARSTLVFFAAAGLTYLVLRSHSRARWLLLGAIYLPVVMLALALVAGYNFSALDALSSGRLSAWEASLDGLRHGPVSQLWAWSTGQVGTYSYAAPAYDPVGAMKDFGAVHVDNSYLEKVLQYGLIGLALFAAPYVMAARRGWLAVSRCAVCRSAYTVFLSLLLGLAVQSITATTIPTFNAPVGFLFAFLGVAPLLVTRFAGHEHAGTARPRRRARVTA